MYTELAVMLLIMAVFFWGVIVLADKYLFPALEERNERKDK